MAANPVQLPGNVYSVGRDTIVGHRHCRPGSLNIGLVDLTVAAFLSLRAIVPFFMSAPGHMANRLVL